MKLEIFKNEQFGDIRTVNENGKILFCGSDVAKALGYVDTAKAIKQHCKEDGWANYPVIDNLGRTQQAKFISESNLYRLIASSKLESAQKFENWIFDEVLPAIRKTGGYVANDQMFIDTYLPFADDTTKQLFANTLETVRKQNKLIVEMKPKALFAEAVETAHTSILIGDMSKILRQNGINIGQNRLFQWLRDNNYLIKNGERKNMPTQRSMDKGLFEIKERTISNPNGVTRIIKTTKITGKGQIYFVHKFLEN